MHTQEAPAAVLLPLCSSAAAALGGHRNLEPQIKGAVRVRGPWQGGSLNVVVPALVRLTRVLHLCAAGYSCLQCCQSVWAMARWVSLLHLPLRSLQMSFISVQLVVIN